MSTSFGERKIRVTRSFLTLSFALFLVAGNGFAQSKNAIGPSLMNVGLAPVIAHARDAALMVYPKKATRRDLPQLSSEEQEEIVTMMGDPVQMYVGIGRKVQLLPSNWAMVKEEGEFRVWQAQIHSPAAMSLQVRFEDFKPGSGAAVKVYSLSDSSPGRVRKYVGRKPEDGDAFWSLSALGDTVVVEYWLPSGDESKPEDFPFSIPLISHTFRDAQGNVAGLDFSPLQAQRAGGCAAGGRDVCASSESTTIQMASKGVARMALTEGSGRSFVCSGSLLNNETTDRALYFLTAWHCVVTPPFGNDFDPAKETTTLRVTSEFEFLADQCNSASARVTGTGSHFIAGSKRGDWALLHIDGELVLAGSGTTENVVVGFLGWDAASRDVFNGFVIHHDGGNEQELSEFEVEKLSFLEEGVSGIFPPCTGPECTHFEASFDRFIPQGGASGAPGFPDEATAQVVGVYTHSENLPGCLGSLSRFSKMYQDGRVRGALTYGDAYFNKLGLPEGFDDSQRPVYSRFSCEGGGKDLEAAEGTGDPGDPYQLTNLCQLQDMDSELDAHYRLASDIDAEESGLMNNVEDNDNSKGLGFKPIGGSSVSTVLSAVIEETSAEGIVRLSEGSTLKLSEEAFAGSFDGAGFVIKGLKIARPEEDHIGLFSIVSTQSRLQRINFSGLSIEGKDGVGAVAGVALGGSIAEFQSRNISIKGRNFVGGVAGYKYAGDIENVDISGRVAGGITGATYAGGVVGYNHSGNIKNVLVLSQMSPMTISGKAQLGGIAGYHGLGDIQDITVNARISGKVAGGSDVGGLVGYKASGDIRRAYLGAVTVEGMISVGGAVGHQVSGSLVDVFSLGQDIVVEGKENVGGLVGLNEASILRSRVVARVQGVNGVGGLVGRHLVGGEISKSFAGGTVEAFGTSGGSFGGLVGDNQSTIRDSYAIGTVHVSTATTAVGGLVGRNDSSIQRSYAASTVRGASDAGGLAGLNDVKGIITDSYALLVVSVPGGTTNLLVGQNLGSTPGSAALSFEQLRCATTPGEACQGEEIYSGWSTQTWDFGDHDTFPRIRGLVFSAPLIGKLLGSDVSGVGVNQFLLCLLPGEKELEMAAEALQGVQPDVLEWKLRPQPAVMTTVFFVVNGDDAGSTLTAGTTQVMVRFERSTAVSDSNFMLSLEDNDSDRRDQLTVTMNEMNSSPRIRLRPINFRDEVEVDSTATTATIELRVGDDEFPCDGAVTWSLARSTPTDISSQVFFSRTDDPKLVNVELPLPSELRQATFTIRFAIRGGKFNDEITVRAIRQGQDLVVYMLRLKALLGGAVR